MLDLNPENSQKQAFFGRLGTSCACGAMMQAAETNTAKSRRFSDGVYPPLSPSRGLPPSETEFVSCTPCFSGLSDRIYHDDLEDPEFTIEISKASPGSSKVRWT